MAKRTKRAQKPRAKKTATRRIARAKSSTTAAPAGDPIAAFLATLAPEQRQWQGSVAAPGVPDGEHGRGDVIVTVRNGRIVSATAAAA